MPLNIPAIARNQAALAADGLILDLEDAVAPDAKEMARQQIGAALKAGVLYLRGLLKVCRHS